MKCEPDLMEQVELLEQLKLTCQCDQTRNMILCMQIALRWAMLEYAADVMTPVEVIKASPSYIAQELVKNAEGRMTQ